MVIGDADTFEPVDELNPVEGDQLYEAAPDAIKETLEPIQTEALDGLTVTVGNALAVIDEPAVLTHPSEFVTVTV